MRIPEPEWRGEDFELAEPPPLDAFEDPFGGDREWWVERVAGRVEDREAGDADEPGPGVAESLQGASYGDGSRGEPPHSLLDLNLEQLEAVEARGPVVLEAPPGSGKTRTLAARVCRILEDTSPQSVLAVTFTRFAAAEMHEQVRAVVGEAADEVNIVTLHALGLGIIRAEADQLGLGKNPGVASPSYAHYLVRKAAKEAGLDKRWDLDGLAREIERAKGCAVGPEEYRVFPGDFYSETVARVYRDYEELLREKNLVDFGDMVRLGVRALETSPEARGFYQHLYRYILVDEWQDTNVAQYRLVRALVGRETDLFVVGDPLQSIYGWRGADPGVFEALERDMRGVRMMRLRVNYRNTGTIALASEGIVRALGLPPRDVEALGGPGEPLALIRCDTERDEALRVAEEIGRLARSDEWGYNDCAVLVRTLRQARLIEQAFLRGRVPYMVAGQRSFFETSAIRGLMAWLRLVADPFDEGALEAALNSPPRGLGRVTKSQLRGGAFRLTMETLLSAPDRDDLSRRVRKKVAQFLEVVDQVHGVRERPLPAILDHVLERTGYSAWLRRADNGNGNGESNGALAGDFPATSDGDNVQNLRRMLEGYRGAGALEKFLQDVDEMQVRPGGTRGVFLGTIHASKGLEWPVVFLPGLDEGILPHAKSLVDKRRLEEEHRLFYVALTRAMQRVYLLGARYRTNVRGQAWEGNPSRFLGYLPAETVRRV